MCHHALPTCRIRSKPLWSASWFGRHGGGTSESASERRPGVGHHRSQVLTHLGVHARECDGEGLEDRQRVLHAHSQAGRHGPSRCNGQPQGSSRTSRLAVPFFTLTPKSRTKPCLSTLPNCSSTVSGCSCAHSKGQRSTQLASPLNAACHSSWPSCGVWSYLGRELEVLDGRHGHPPTEVQGIPTQLIVPRRALLPQAPQPG